jgi:hypothetical protein
VNLPFLQWLLPKEAPGDRALVVQTGSPHLFARVLDRLCESYPDSTFTGLLQKNMRGKVPERDDVDYIDNQGPKPAFVKMLRERSFDRIYVLYSNEPGYWKLKLVPFLLGPRAIYVVNENLDWFPIDLRRSETIAAHLRWRMESSITFSGDVEFGSVMSAAKAVAYPAVLAYLAAYERSRSRTLGEAATTWKQQNRPHGEASK